MSREGKGIKAFQRGGGVMSKAVSEQNSNKEPWRARKSHKQKEQKVKEGRVERSWPP